MIHFQQQQNSIQNHVKYSSHKKKIYEKYQFCLYILMVGTRFQNKNSNIYEQIEKKEEQLVTKNSSKKTRFSSRLKNRKNNHNSIIKKKSRKRSKRNHKFSQKVQMISKDIETVENQNESEKQSDLNNASQKNQSIVDNLNKEELKQVSDDESLILNTSEESLLHIKQEERKEEYIQNSQNNLSEQKQDQTTKNKDLPEIVRKIKRKPGRPKGSLNKQLTSEERERRKNKHSKIRGRPRKYPKLDDIIENEISTLGNELDYKNAQYKDPAPLSIEQVMKINQQRAIERIEFIEDHQFDVLYGHLGVDEPLQIVGHKLAFFIKQETSKVTLDLFYEIEFDLTEEKTLLKNNFYRKEDIYKQDKYMLKAYIQQHKELYQEWRQLNKNQDNQMKYQTINLSTIEGNDGQVFLSDEEIKENKINNEQNSIYIKKHKLFRQNPKRLLNTERKQFRDAILQMLNYEKQFISKQLELLCSFFCVFLYLLLFGNKIFNKLKVVLLSEFI
ncbi:hypothetical protein pb186bvf_005413 [Paramecium bursaria]